MPFQPGTRLRSAVCDTEVIVVRGGSTEIALTCGGQPMILKDTLAPSGAVPITDLMGGNGVGKRYASAADAGFEVLVTRAGAGTLGDGPIALTMLDPKSLPASD